MEMRYQDDFASVLLKPLTLYAQINELRRNYTHAIESNQDKMYKFNDEKFKQSRRISIMLRDNKVYVKSLISFSDSLMTFAFQPLPNN